MQGKVLVIYHNKDLDGFCSGFLIQSAYEAYGFKVDMAGYDHGNIVPNCQPDEYESIFMVDICFSGHVMKGLTQLPHFYLIDHHVGTYESLKEINPLFVDSGRYIYDCSKAACELCDEFTGFRFGKNNQLIDTIARWDIHGDSDKHDFEEIAQIQLGLETMLHDPSDPDSGDYWNLNLLDAAEGLSIAKEKGEAIAEYIKKQNRQMPARLIKLDGRVFEFYNMPANRYAGFETNRPKCFGVAKNKGWRYSLRGDNVLPHSQKRGGSGHKNAAGFFSIESPYEISDSEG